MKKSLLIIIIVAVLILGSLAGAFLYVKEKTTLDVPAASLILAQGDVEVIRNGESINIDKEQFELLEGDTIITKDAKAKVNIYDSIIVSLEPNSEIQLNSLLANNIQIEQKSGQTWNKITRLMGITKYELKTPTSVATVRGTDFSSNVDKLLSRLILVDGKLYVSNGKTNKMLDKLMKVEVTKEDIAEANLTKEESEYIKSKLEETYQDLILIRTNKIKRLLKKNEGITKKLESDFNVNAEEYVISYMNDIDNNKKTFDDLRSDVRGLKKKFLIIGSAINTGFIDQLEELDKAIQKQKQINALFE